MSLLLSASKAARSAEEAKRPSSTEHLDAPTPACVTGGAVGVVGAAGRSPAKRHRRFAHARGYTLVELMVAVAIGLAVVLMGVVLHLHSGQQSRRVAAQVQLQTDGTLLVALLAQQLRLAGYSDLDAQGRPHFDGLAVRGCAGGFVDDAAAFDSLACRAAGSGSATRPQSLAIRHQADARATVQVDGGQPSNCVLEAIGPWAASSAQPGRSYPLADHRYFVEPDEDGTPTLYCRDMRANGTMGSKQALAAQVEDLRLRYAVTRAPTPADPAPDQVTAYLAADHPALGTDAAGWRRVVGIQLCVVLRSATPVETRNTTALPYPDCDDRQRLSTDGRLRQALRTTVFLHNLRPARAQDGA